MVVMDIYFLLKFVLLHVAQALEADFPPAYLE